uniref:Uncharacterized protein n=1 Tax=Micrurus corallinus TaxID=54390 RepID=A0A2D4FMG0_MICCO
MRCVTGIKNREAAAGHVRTALASRSSAGRSPGRVALAGSKVHGRHKEQGGGGSGRTSGCSSVTRQTAWCRVLGSMAGSACTAAGVNRTEQNSTATSFITPAQLTSRRSQLRQYVEPYNGSIVWTQQHNKPCSVRFNILAQPRAAGRQPRQCDKTHGGAAFHMCNNNKPCRVLLQEATPVR